MEIPRGSGPAPPGIVSALSGTGLSPPGRSASLADTPFPHEGWASPVIGRLRPVIRRPSPAPGRPRPKRGKGGRPSRVLPCGGHCLRRDAPSGNPSSRPKNPFPASAQPPPPPNRRAGGSSPWLTWGPRLAIPLQARSRHSHLNLLSAILGCLWCRFLHGSPLLLSSARAGAWPGRPGWLPTQAPHRPVRARATGSLSRCAIRCSFVERGSRFSDLGLWPTNGSVTRHPPSLHGVPRRGSPASSVL